MSAASDSREPPDRLCDNRSDPATRAVLLDWHEERGHKVSRLGVLLDRVDLADDDAAAADDADAADADDAADDDDDDDADAAADDADDADADDDADGIIRNLNQNLYGDLDMRNGLKILRLPGGRYYSITRVGWLRRVGGDEWELIGGRTVVRTASADAGGLDRLASHGIEKRYKLAAAAALPEEINRHLIKRSLVANPEAWAKDCPKPKDWRDE